MFMTQKIQELKEKMEQNNNFSEGDMEKILEKISKVDIEPKEIDSISVVNREEDVRFKLLEKAIYNVLNEVKNPEIYILPMYESYDIISKKDFDNLPKDDPLKKKISIFMYPFGGKMDFEYWIYSKERECFIKKITNKTTEVIEGTGIDLFKHFSSKQDILATINVAFMGLNAKDEDLQYISNIISYYKSRFGERLKEVFLNVEI